MTHPLIDHVIARTLPTVPLHEDVGVAVARVTASLSLCSFTAKQFIRIRSFTAKQFIRIRSFTAKQFMHIFMRMQTIFHIAAHPSLRKKSHGNAQAKTTTQLIEVNERSERANE